MADIGDIVLLGLVGVGGYYLLSSGIIQNMMMGMGGSGPPPGYGYEDPRLPTEEDILLEAKKVGGKKGKKDDDDDDDDRKKRSKDKDKPPEDGMQGMFGPEGAYPPQMQQPQGYPPNIDPRRAVGPPPGAISSLKYVDYPVGPPYISSTVGTYSQYSPYNQFNSYQQYQSPAWGVLSSMADDNTNFQDIDISKPGCFACKTSCMANPNGYHCRLCRLGCKRVSHTYKPPATGWTIAPVNQGGQPQVFFAQIWDALTNPNGATFAEMDDYSEKKKFDCHNKLKRRVRGKDNSFVSQKDYYFDRNDINIIVE